MSATILARSYARLPKREGHAYRPDVIQQDLSDAIDAFPFGRVDVLHIKNYNAEALAVTIQIEVGLGAQGTEPLGTEQRVAKALRKIVRRVTGYKKAEAQATSLDNCEWFDTEPQS